MFVFSAGNWENNNDVSPMYPQNFDFDNIVVVLSTDPSDKEWDSSIGPTTVDLGAPGALVRSCGPDGLYYDVYGTSFAQAFVAGAAALIWAVNPDLTCVQVKDILLDTVDPNEDLEEKCLTGGRLNLYKALHRASLLKPGGFAVKNASGEPVARFADSGDLFLAGTLTENTTPTATANDEFRIQDSAGNDVAIVDMTNGNMYLAGSVQATWANPSEGSDDFIIRTSSDPNGVAYIDDSGNLYLKGSAYGPEP